MDVIQIFTEMWWVALPLVIAGIILGAYLGRLRIARKKQGK